MSDLQIIATFVVFASVISIIALDLLDLALAGLLGVSALIAFGVFTLEDILNIVRTFGGSLALLFGGMVVARTLLPTGLFDYIGNVFLKATRGSGKRFLLGLIMLIAPLCAFLPNATTVVLVAPIIIRVASALQLDLVPALVLTAIVSNSAGLLSLVGDPATFLVGNAIGMTFTRYLRQVSLGGLLSLLALLPLLPWLMGNVWRAKCPLPEELRSEPLKRPFFAASSLVVLAVMVLLFLFGDYLPVQIVPPSAAIIACSLALLSVYGAKIEPLDKVLNDIDWKTLIFLACMFCLVEAFTKTGILQGLSQSLYGRFGVNLMTVALVMLAGVGLASSFLANIPVVAAMILLVKGYFVIARLVPEDALGATFVEWPVATLPVFVAMMFGATLGGNGTLIGASANIVCAGISARHGKPLSFGTFMRYGMPLMLCQLAVAAVYVWGLYYVMGR
ncbi:MAG TPA: SLC13 family permease [Candidatus Binatia bacterium]|jgi:Na+/H+ antiporter NhaD/arsenite permease-like protein